MPPPFKVGQTVTCINSSDFKSFHNETVPVLNHNYTIRSIITDPSDAAQQCLRLKEIVNPITEYRNGTAECAFHANRFVVKKGKP